MAALNPPLVTCEAVLMEEVPNLPHVDLDMMGNCALAKIREAVLAVTGS
jgi:pyruvate dehydrogenase (quinone)